MQKPVLAGLELPDFRALNPAARQGLETVANVRLHRATREQPVPAWPQERPSLSPLPLPPFDSATVSQVRASRQFRLTLETNRYAVPAHYASQALTLTTSPDRLCIDPGAPLLARHRRRDERFHDVEAPDHPKPLLAQRKKARDHPLCLRFLALSPRAAASDLQLDARRLHPPHHVRQIGALRDLYAPDAVARAREEAFPSEAFSAEDITHLVEQRARCPPEASAFHLTRRADLLEISRAPPDLSLYHATPQPQHHET